MTLPKDCNKRLKDAFLSAVYGTQRNDHPSITSNGYKHDLKEHYHKVEQRGGKSKTSTAKKLIRVMHAMVKNEEIYMPRKRHMPPRQLDSWIEIATQKMFKKWADYKVYPDQSNKLGEWQKKKDEIIKVLENT